MHMHTLLLDSLNTRWDNYKAGLKTCRREYSEEAVHDFRVAARRLLSSLDLLRTVMRDPGIKKIRRILKDQLDKLDDLRNTQVLLADISKTIQETPVLQSYQEYLQLREKKLLRAARKAIKSLKVASLSKRIKKLNEAIRTLKQADLDMSLFLAVDKAYAIVNQRYALIDPGQPTTIHRVRLAFKKFRYMVEAIYPILQNFPADHLNRMHAYQASMGYIQDMEVALQGLADFDKLAPASYDPEPARLYYRERHVLALSRFIKDKGEIITFWRSAPDQPFPQEK
jgi:CHAD domain-containing protein